MQCNCILYWKKNIQFVSRKHFLQPWSLEIMKLVIWPPESQVKMCFRLCHNKWGKFHVHFSSHIKFDILSEKNVDIPFPTFSQRRAWVVHASSHGIWKILRQATKVLEMFFSGALECCIKLSLYNFSIQKIWSMYMQISWIVTHAGRWKRAILHCRLMQTICMN